MDSATVTRGEKLLKAPTGIRGFDELTGGGLPDGRPTLVCGGPGCGKTLFGMEFLIHGAVDHGEPGVFVSFEETAVDLAKNVASLGYDLGALIEEKKIAVDYIRVERSEIEETGEYDLEGLFIRIGYALQSIKAKRAVLDTIEALFASLPNEGILRAELRRLFGWMKERGVTTVITAERGDGDLTRRGLEEYVSDCVILLDQRVHDQVATRRLRVVKYRGTSHGTNEYPFLIHERGFSVMPSSSIGLAHEAPTERISLGVPGIDAMLGGKGLYRGGSVLVTGTAGSGKSSLSAHAAYAAAQRGERCLYFAFEESQAQIIRNMRSIGIDLEPGVRSGLIRFRVSRPSLFGLEMHLTVMHREIEDFDSQIVIVDPITNLQSSGTTQEINAMLVRLIDYIKVDNRTGIFTSLTSGGEALENTQVGVSSLMDTWILLRFIEGNGERNRGIYVLKSRGMAHSNQVREYLLTDQGIQILDVYAGPSGVLTGTARRTQEAKERAEKFEREQEIERRRLEVLRKREVLAAQIAATRAEMESLDDEVRRLVRAEELRMLELSRERDELSRIRMGEEAPGAKAWAQSNGELT